MDVAHRALVPRSFPRLGLEVTEVQAPPPPDSIRVGATAPAASGGSSIGTWIVLGALAVGGYYAWTNRDRIAEALEPVDDEEGPYVPSRAEVARTVGDLRSGAMLDSGNVGEDGTPQRAAIEAALQRAGYALREKDWGYVAEKA